MATKAATAWGDVTVLDEVTIPQRAGEKEFASVVQLLAGASGERYVRFAYTTDGTARRGPVTLREEDIVRLRDVLVDHPELAGALAFTPSRPRGGGRRGRNT